MAKQLKLYDQEMNVNIEWNGGNLFNVYSGRYDEVCIDCFTIYQENQKPWTTAQARKIILKHFEEMAGN